MIGTCFAGFHHAHNPVRQVAHVDKLYRIARRSRCGYFASLSDAIRPVGKAVGGVMRANDETGPYVENATGHSLFSGSFTQRFQGTIGFIGDLFHCFVGQSSKRGRFIHSGLAKVGVDGNTGDEGVVIDRV